MRPSAEHELPALRLHGAFVSQAPNGYWHCPELQVCPLGQAWPQAPQFSESVSKSLQPAGVWQHTMPAAQASPPLQEHTLLPCFFSHASPATQVVPSQLHRPVLDSQLPVTPPPTSHCLSPVQPQRAPSQTKPPLAPWAAQLLVQLPQCCTSFDRLASQPSSGPLMGVEQSPKPASHSCWQSPPTQFWAVE